MTAAGITKTISPVRDLLAEANIYAVTDSNVFALYRGLFGATEPFVIPSGETSKTLDTVGDILADMTARGCDRHTRLIAIGGGVVGDTAGFAAAVFMRGIRWVNVPTTLLAQVDSGIGGKTGVDIKGYKNIAGSFHLPERVEICTDFLRTLPEREWLCGMGEIVKHACLNENIFEFLTANFDKLLARDGAATRQAVELNVRYKESVVGQDFRESGFRKRLNAGHTIGHAVEKLDAFRLSHGEYVAAGLIAEMKMFRGGINDEFFAEIERMASRVCSGPPRFSAAEILSVARADKKNAQGKISFMIATKSGRVTERLITDEEFLRRAKCL